MDTSSQLYAATDVEIIRTGQFTDMNGNKVAIDDAMLSDIEAGYAPDTLHEAKLTKDHQRDGAAVGRITKLRKDGGRLLADIAGLSLSTAESIAKTGVWNNRSAEISFQITEDKRPYLKNVSILSARPPAIKGMARIEPNQIVPMVAFSEPEGTATYSYYFQEVDMPNDPTPSAAEIALSENLKQKDIELAEAKAQIESLKVKADKADKLEPIVLSSQAALARADAKEFISQFPRRIVPAVRDIALACLCPDANGEICLSESDGKTVKLSGPEAFKAFIKALPDFGPALNAAAGDGYTPPDPNLAAQPTADELAFAERIYPNKDSAEYKAHIAAIIKSKGGSA